MKKISFFVLMAAALALFASPAKAETCAGKYPVVDESLKRMEAQTGIPRAVVWAIAEIETKCNPSTVGTVGEVGLFQVIPRDQTFAPAWHYADRPLAAELRDQLVGARTAVYILDKNMRRFCAGRVDGFGDRGAFAVDIDGAGGGDGARRILGDKGAAPAAQVFGFCGAEDAIAGVTDGGEGDAGTELDLGGGSKVGEMIGGKFGEKGKYKVGPFKGFGSEVDSYIKEASSKYGMDQLDLP
jgi:hypothetical protein